MQSMNSVVIEGNLTRDPVQRETPKGNTVTVMSIASNRYFGTGDERTEEVSFFEIEAWNNLGNTCYKHLTKGRGVRVAGRLKQDRWQTVEGDNRSRIKVIASTVDFKPQIIRQSDDAGHGDLEDALGSADVLLAPEGSEEALEDGFDESDLLESEEHNEADLPESVYATRPEAQLVGVAEADPKKTSLKDELLGAPAVTDAKDLEPTLAKVSKQARNQKGVRV
jgi:single-strand DNA-binding protein